MKKEKKISLTGSFLKDVNCYDTQDFQINDKTDKIKDTIKERQLEFCDSFFDYVTPQFSCDYQTHSHDYQASAWLRVSD